MGLLFLMMSILINVALVVLGQAVRRPMPENQLPIPDYYGLYAVTDKGLVEMKAGGAVVNAGTDVEFIFYSKDAAAADTFQLFKVPTQNERQQISRGKKNLQPWENSFNNTLADNQATLEGLPRGSTQIEIRGKSISSKPEMVRLIPSDLLSPGVYQIGTRNGDQSWYHFSVSGFANSISADVTESSPVANNSAVVPMPNPSETNPVVVPDVLQETLTKAQAGDVQAQLDLGEAYLHGKIVSRDLEQAMQWFRKAAEQGNAMAQARLGVLIGNFRGKQNYDEALEWLRKSADQNCADGESGLAFMYHNGRGVEKDDDQAVKLFLKAAQQDNSNAEYELGFMYQSGEGVSKDYVQAVSWYRKAADQGYPMAQYQLGEVYENGRGVDKDNAEAVKWFQKSADQGNPLAKAALQKINNGQ